MDDSAADDICREQGLTRANFWVILYRARIRMWQCLSRNWYGENTTSEEMEP
jgi:RNA polymerase sigma-70 factor (ECF subfamily)